MCSQLFGLKVESLARSGDTSPLSCSRASSLVGSRDSTGVLRPTNGVEALELCTRSRKSGVPRPMRLSRAVLVRGGDRRHHGALPLTRDKLVREKGKICRKSSNQMGQAPKGRRSFTWPTASNSWAGSGPGSAHARRMAGSRC